MSFTGLWNNVYGAPYALTGSRNKLERDIAIAFEKAGSQPLSAVAIALNGSAVGGTAARTRARVLALRSLSGYDLGGQRAIETVTDINRATTAADETALDAIYNGVFALTSYPVDRSGNGGGGKVGRL